MSTLEQQSSPRPRVVIAHDYLTQRGGAERVVLAMSRAFPEAPIVTTLYDPEGTYPEFRERTIITSPINRVGALRRDHRKALPVLAPAASALVADADVVVVSSSGWAHGFRTSGKRLVYCYSPARWLYQTETYLGGSAHASVKGLVVIALRPALKVWDRRAARRATKYLAISRVVRERIAAAYGIDSQVVSAPHSVDTSAPQEDIPELGDTTGYHLVVSRLLPYKNVDKVIEAFRDLPDERLVVIGAGPMQDDLEASAPDNVALLRGLTDAQMRRAYARARAIIAPSFEDFGLTPLEGGAFGHPTLALRAGGYLDTIREGETGAFFEEPSPEAIRAAVLANRERTWDPEVIRAHVDTFDERHFIQRLHDEVDALLG